MKLHKKSSNISQNKKNKLLELVEKFPEQKIVVLGDLMLDRYLWSSVDRISPEAPVPIAKIENETNVPGGAANTACNLADLDIKVELIGTIGNDQSSIELVKILKSKQVGLSGLLVDESKPTTIKTRIMAGNFQLLRFDYENPKPVHLRLEKLLMETIKSSLKQVKVIIISDYSKGLISSKVAKETIRYARRLGIKVLVDPTPHSFMKYKNSYLIKPNKKEAEELAGEKINSDYSNLQIIGNKIIKLLNAKIALITLGKDGIAALKDDGVFFKVPTSAREVYDVSGAGDTTMATLAAGISSGGSLRQATMLANISAGIVVSKLGTATCTRSELVDKIKNNS